MGPVGMSYGIALPPGDSYLQATKRQVLGRGEALSAIG